jgi:GT2 family glycosyltransferase
MDSAEDMSIEVILVDNGSKDNSIDVAKSIFSDIIVVENDRNLGFATACNQGAAKANGRYVLLLNNDVILGKSMLRSLVQFADCDVQAAMWQPTVKLPDGSLDTAGSFFTMSGFIRHRGWAQFNDRLLLTPSRVFSVKGACMLLNRTALESVKGLDGSFFCYWEETDLAWRLQLRGWEIRFVPICCAEHKNGATVSRILSDADRNYLSFRNRFHAILRNSSITTLIKVVPIHLACCLVVALQFAIGRRRDCSLAVCRAIWWNLRHLNSLRRERSVVQGYRTVSDRVLFRDVSSRIPFVEAMGDLRKYVVAFKSQRPAG